MSDFPLYKPRHRRRHENNPYRPLKDRLDREYYEDGAYKWNYDDLNFYHYRRPY